MKGRVFKVVTLTSEDIQTINKEICLAEGNPVHTLDFDRIESAMHSAFYPGSPPFVHGGIAKLAGALCYYLVMAHAFQDGNKRTGLAAALLFLQQNGWDLKYPLDDSKSIDALADLILEVASGNRSKEETMDWFEAHKVPL